MIFFCLNIWKYLLWNLNLVISTYYFGHWMMTWLWGLYFLTGWWGNHFEPAIRTQYESAKLNNLVKNLYFLRDIGYDFFLLKHLKVSIVKPESDGFNLLFWPLNNDLVVGSLLFDRTVGKSFSNQTTRTQCPSCQLIW